MSFTKGSRQCLGMHLAYAELYVMLAGLIRRTKFELREGVTEEAVKVQREYLVALPYEGKRVEVGVL